MKYVTGHSIEAWYCFEYCSPRKPIGKTIDVARRKFIAAFGGTPAARPLVTHAQQLAPVVTFINSSSAAASAQDVLPLNSHKRILNPIRS